ncbi:hypothetical protein [Paenibacillus borealis]|uniref:Uncharacterized protein n=1 Tax=Paenibacillus borealis TaxID=160799 RepID=A0A089MHV6_PAEBO|nr:hypothetical protein [Paenibacillus borealis]AIQ56179.1 hypothetical protein PBOR_03815 [Paenibacillus borealis]
MPLPILVPIIAALGGVVAGTLSRQPEVNRLKQQVRTLQAEIQRLQALVKEQDRQIKELKIRYNALKAYQFTEKIKQKSKLKGALMFQYSFKEYMDLLVAQARGGNYVLVDDETYFFNSFEHLMNTREISVEEKLLIRTYIRTKYAYEIDNQIEPQMGDIVEKVEKINVA